MSGPSLGNDGYFGTLGSISDPNGFTYTQGGSSGGSTKTIAGSQGGTTQDVFIDMAQMIDARGDTQAVYPGGTDSVGRVPVTMQTNGNQLIYTVNDSGGNSQTYTVNLESIPIKTLFGVTNGGTSVSEYTNTRTTISSVVLPNSQRYSFSYDNYGDITRIDLPTGGFVLYVWDNVTINGEVMRSITSRTVYDGVSLNTWGINYSYSSISSTNGDMQSVVTLTSPADSQGITHQTVLRTKCT